MQSTMHVVNHEDFNNLHFVLNCLGLRQLQMARGRIMTYTVCILRKFIISTMRKPRFRKRCKILKSSCRPHAPCCLIGSPYKRQSLDPRTSSVYCQYYLYIYTQVQLSSLRRRNKMNVTTIDYEYGVIKYYKPGIDEGIQKKVWMLVPRNSLKAEVLDQIFPQRFSVDLDPTFKRYNHAYGNDDMPTFQCRKCVTDGLTDYVTISKIVKLPNRVMTIIYCLHCKSRTAPYGIQV